MVDANKLMELWREGMAYENSGNINAALEKYDEIILSFPIWWYVAPTIVNTFLESYEVKNKRIILFPTSGMSKFGNTVEELKISVDNSSVIEEGTVSHSRVSQKEVEEWVKKYKL